MTFVSIIQATAALYVFYMALMALNRMSSKTRNTVRYAHVALVGGAAAAVASCVVARDVLDCLFAVGVALYMATDQRRGDK